MVCQWALKPWEKEDGICEEEWDDMGVKITFIFIQKKSKGERRNRISYFALRSLSPCLTCVRDRSGKPTASIYDR